MSSMVFRSFSATVLVLFSLRATAAPPEDAELTADIAGDAAVQSSNPTKLVVTGGELVFGAAGAIWRSDGTAQGTVKVVEAEHETAALLGDYLVFSVTRDAGFTRPISSSDVWAKGEGELERLFGGLHLGGETFLRFGNALVVSHPTALWITRGTPASSEPLRDPFTGFLGPVSVLGPQLFFERADEAGPRLWRSDGTRAGTALFSDLPLGSPSSNPGGTPPFSPLVSLPSALLFLADNEDGGLRLWRLGDGPSELPSLVVDLAPEAIEGSQLRASYPLGDGVVLLVEIASSLNSGTFDRRCELWQSEGTALDTVRLAVLEGFSCPSELAVAGELVYFAHGTQATGVELWRYRLADGDLAMVADVQPAGQSSNPGPLVPYGDRLAFLARPSAGAETEANVPARDQLYITDGSAGGTVRLTDSPSATGERSLVVFGGLLYFPGWDAEHGHELWRSDGTLAGTALFVDLEADVASSSPQQAMRHGDEILLLAARSDQGLELHRSDGTATGTELVDGSPGSLRRLLGVVGSRAIVEQELSGDSTRLWSVDLDNGMAVLLGDFDQAILDAIVVADRVVFAGRTAEHGIEPWVTDGTVAGTRLLADLAPGSITVLNRLVPRYSLPSEFVRIGPTVYFTTRMSQPLSPGQGPPPNRVWRTDGAAAPQAVTEMEEASGFAKLRVLGGLLFVLTGNSIQVIDSASGQIRALELQDCSQCRVVDAVPLRGRLAMVVFEPSGQSSSTSLWWSDGTQLGTLRGITLSDDEPFWWFSTGRRLFYFSSLNDGGNHVPDGYAIWTSDGTEIGTRSLVEFPGLLLTQFGSALGVFDGALLFAADTLSDGVELWRSDGSEEGTFRLTDLVPGPGSSHPSDVVALGDRVHFAATSPDVGRELFSLPRSVLARPCASDATTECLGQRFEVSVDWLAPNTGEHGRANVVPELATDDTSIFWFFDDENLELAVKLLDGRAISGHHWVYYGALSDVAYWVSVTDSETGRTITYGNPAGIQCGRGDVLAFPDEEVLPGEESGELRPGGEPPPPRPERLDSVGPPAVCDGEFAACLGGGRFRVEVDWRHPAALDVVRFARPLPGTDDTAAFWFFDAENIELLVKVLDARDLNGRFWVYFGALSDVAYEIRVTDTTTGATRVYRNRQGTLCGGADVEAF